MRRGRREFPGRLYVVVPAANLEEMIGGARPPALVQLRGTRLGSLDPNDFVATNTPLPFRLFRDGARASDVADACLYRSSDGVLEPDPEYAADKEYAAEIERRRRIAAPPRR